MTEISENIHKRKPYEKKFVTDIACCCLSVSLHRGEGSRKTRIQVCNITRNLPYEGGTDQRGYHCAFPHELCRMENLGYDGCPSRS